MNKIAKNFFYQIIFQITSIILPIITIPIISNALGPEGIGVFNFTNSIVQFFVLAAGLGVSIYGNREIALAWNKKENISETFWEIFLFKFVISVIVLSTYLVVVSFLENRIIFYMQALVLVSTMFDISWFFMGVEDFKKTSLCSLIVRIITFFLIVFLIREPNDVVLYTLIQGLGALFSQVLVWLFIKKYISFVRITFKNSFNHFFGSIRFFLPQVAISLYTNLNKILLGFFLGTTAVGFFANSLQINNIIITIITTLDLVLLPHMSGLFAKNDESKMIQMMEKTLHLQLFFSIPLMFGILTIYDKLIPWFFGEQFLFINYVMPWFSVLIVVIPLGMAISRQYLMPVGKIKDYNISVMMGAAISLLANLILLPTIGFFGAVIATLLAESFVTFVRLNQFLKTTDFKFEKFKIFTFILSGLVMLIVTRLLTHNMSASLFTNLVQAIVGASIYLFVTSLFKQNILWSLLKKNKSS